MLQDTSGNSEVIAFYDDTLFCGFACLLTYRDITHIIYFAIDDALCGKGYGSAALTAMSERKTGNRIIIDIEVEQAEMLPTMYSVKNERISICATDMTNQK